MNMKIIDTPSLPESPSGGFANRPPHLLALTQCRLSDQLVLLIDQVALSLAEDESKAVHESPAATGVAAMMSEARQREQRARNRRLLAEDLVFCAMRNLDNPDWHAGKADSATVLPTHGDGKFLLDLLSWTPPD